MPGPPPALRCAAMVGPEAAQKPCRHQKSRIEAPWRLIWRGDFWVGRVHRAVAPVRLVAVVLVAEEDPQGVAAVVAAIRQEILAGMQTEEVVLEVVAKVNVATVS